MRSAPSRAARTASTLPMSGPTTPGRTATPMPTRPIGAFDPTVPIAASSSTTPCGTTITSAAGGARSAARSAGAAANSMWATWPLSRSNAASAGRMPGSTAPAERTRRSSACSGCTTSTIRRAAIARPIRPMLEPRATRSMALRSGRAPREARQQLGLRLRPFADGHAVHHRVADRAVAAHRVMAQDAVLPRAQPLDRALAREVEIVGAPADEFRAQRLEGVRHEEQLGACVDVRALAAPGVPRVADLEPLDRGDDVVVARRADHVAGARVEDGKRQAVTFGEALQRALDVAARVVGVGDAGDADPPQLAVGGGALQPLDVLQAERLEPDAVVGQRDRQDGQHARLESSRCRRSRQIHASSGCGAA